MEYEELMNAAELVSSDNKEDIQRGLSIAASIERESSDFYSKQAEKAENEELKRFFNFLAKQEKEHLDAIGKLRAAVEEKGEWIVFNLPNEEFHPFTEKDWDRGNETAFTAILFALWKEEQARQFYEKAAEKIKDKKGKQFFKTLAEFEHRHAKMLGKYVEESYYSHKLVMG